MRARQPLKPGRIKLAFEDGTVQYAVLTRADDPVEEGHPLNPHTLLKDETCRMLGGDPETMVPDDAFQMLAALAAGGGSGSGDVGDLEDAALEVGAFTNAGAGWNTYKFREAFDAPPQVVLKAEDFMGTVDVKSVTKDGFLYCLREMVVGAGSVSTGTLYTGAGTGTNPSHSAHTVVTGVTLPTVSMSTTKTAVRVNYIAIEYGGER